MPNIKPVSDLRNYNEVLVECEEGNPVFLTKNGRGNYVIIDIKEYECQQAVLKLISKLNEAENIVTSEKDWLEFEELKKALED